MNTSLLFLFTLVFTACSTKAPPNRWQYQSNSAYKNFEQYYLENHTDMAASEFNRARSYATQSADLSTLARIELSRCALKFALLEPFSCKEYEDLIPLTHDRELLTYYSFLSGKATAEFQPLLPHQYQKLASLQIQNNNALIDQEIKTMTPLTSRMIAAALEFKHLDESTIEAIITDASYLGYKHAVIVWMNVLIERTSDSEKRKILRSKIAVLLKNK